MQTVLPVHKLVGTMLGEYKIERLLNHGTLGTVYIASKIGQTQSVMVTLFSLPEKFPEQARNIFWTRFHREGQKLIKIRHPHILPLHTYGQYASYPYIVSSFVKGRSLAQVLKQQPIFTPQQTLNVLKQVTVGLDYIHSHDVVHGLLNPTSLLVDNFQNIQLGGIGLRPILEMYGIERSNHPYAHLYSITETFLGIPEYLAPECARSEPVDARTDIYSLGIILFEMLTGTRPFTGADKFEVVLQHLQSPVPSLRTVFPQAPIQLDQVIQKALQRHPAQRFQTAQELAQAFEQALQGQQVNEQIGDKNVAVPSDMTLPPTVDWFAQEKSVDISAHGVPTMTMSYLSSLEPASMRMPAQSRPAPEAPLEGRTMAFHRLSDNAQKQKQAAKVIGGDPFAMWSAPSANQQQSQKTPSILANQQQSQKTPSILANQQQSQKTPSILANQQQRQKTPSILANQQQRQKPAPDLSNQQKQSQKTASVSAGSKKGKSVTKPGRRKVIAMLTAGGVVAVVGLGLEGVNLARALHQNSTAQTTTTKTEPMRAKEGLPPAHQPATATEKSATNAGHAGMVVGSAALAKNSAKEFTNPVDNKQAILLHLSNGTFVASERACTHQGVPVDYDKATGKLVCPLHGSIFDPTNDFAVLQGPATTALKPITIKVNSDGTITV